MTSSAPAGRRGSGLPLALGDEAPARTPDRREIDGRNEPVPGARRPTARAPTPGRARPAAGAPPPTLPAPANSADAVAPYPQAFDQRHAARAAPAATTGRRAASDHRCATKRCKGEQDDLGDPGLARCGKRGHGEPGRADDAPRRAPGSPCRRCDRQASGRERPPCRTGTNSPASTEPAMARARQLAADRRMNQPVGACCQTGKPITGSGGKLIQRNALAPVPASRIGFWLTPKLASSV